MALQKRLNSHDDLLHTYVYTCDLTLVLRLLIHLNIGESCAGICELHLTQVAFQKLHTQAMRSLKKKKN